MSAHREPPEHEESPPLQERDRPSGRALAVIAITSVLIGLFSVWFEGYMLETDRGTIAGKQPKPATMVPRTLPPAPSSPAGFVPVEQTQIEAVEVGEAVRDRQRRELETWGWADRQKGLAQIPIERAMDLVVQQESQR